MPRWEGKIYAGDSTRGGISRQQSNEFILATDPRFDGFISISHDDFYKLSELLLSCQSTKELK